jgi:hypothetical protein
MYRDRNLKFSTRERGIAREPCDTPWGACGRLWLAMICINKGQISLRSCFREYRLKAPLARWRRRNMDTNVGVRDLCLNSRVAGVAYVMAPCQWHVERVHLRDLFLRPLQISPHLTGVSHSVLESFSRLGETSLCLLLQVHEFAVLCIQFSRAICKLVSVCKQARGLFILFYFYFIVVAAIIQLLGLLLEILHLRLRLDRHAAVKRDRIKRVRETVLHVLLEIDTASRVGAVIVV